MTARLVRLAPIVMCLLLASHQALGDAPRPNVVLIMTDDQGIGDFGATGNRVIQTPHIDQMAEQSTRLTTFYVSPVCSPTRACLMTGRYNYRTRCIDTWLGRSMMEPDEVTVAEALSGAGYATGIFGKWHLGDCYPMRPMDQGFEEALVHRGGGLAQPSEPRENNRRYTDPILFHNGEQVQTKGYCTDVYFDAALKFIEQAHEAERNFFVYLPTNAPHGPYHDVPEELRQQYMQRQQELAELIVPNLSGQKRAAELDKLARIAAMITNVDQNVGRLLDKLQQMQLTDNTLVIFLTDNGPNTRRYVGNCRGMKGEVFEGGIRTLLLLHWPAMFANVRARGELAAHIDLMPTILDACSVAADNLSLDGRSLMPLFRGEAVDWSDRTLVIQSHRGDAPVRYHHFMIRDEKWKLVHPSGFGRESFPGSPKFELYNLQADPRESRNLVDEEPEITQRLKSAYDRWFDDVSSTRPDNYAPPRIWIGAPQEKETVLTRQDWRGGTWAPDAIGSWQLHVAADRAYTIQLEFDSHKDAGKVQLNIGGKSYSQTLEPNATSATFTDIELPQGDTTLKAVIQQDTQHRGIYQATIR